MINDLNAMMEVSDRNPGKLSELLAALAEGDLTARMDGQFHGVFAGMRDDANTTATQLAGIVGRIQRAASSITGWASEIATDNNDLSQRTERQPPTWRKPLPRWRSSPPPSSRMPKVRVRPINRPSAQPVSRFRLADAPHSSDMTPAARKPAVATVRRVAKASMPAPATYRPLVSAPALAAGNDRQ